MTLSLSLPEYLVTATNTGHGSDNKIHDDEVAKRFGFIGALVPGVDVYAYMVHAPVSHWGIEWLEHGYMHLRLNKPVYEGDKTFVNGLLKNDDTMFVTAGTERGLCSEGSALLRPDCDPSRIVLKRAVLPNPVERPSADKKTLRVGTTLGSRDECAPEKEYSAYLSSVHEHLPIFGDEKVVHPGYLLRRANLILRENVLLGPWIHVESWVWNLRTLSTDESLTTRAVVTDNFERKGHSFVDLDVSLLAGDTDPVARIKHRSIYLPRQLRDNT